MLPFVTIVALMAASYRYYLCAYVFRSSDLKGSDAKLEKITIPPGIPEDRVVSVTWCQELKLFEGEGRRFLSWYIPCLSLEELQKFLSITHIGIQYMITPKLPQSPS